MDKISTIVWADDKTVVYDLCMWSNDSHRCSSSTRMFLDDYTPYVPDHITYTNVYMSAAGPTCGRQQSSRGLAKDHAQGSLYPVLGVLIHNHTTNTITFDPEV